MKLQTLLSVSLLAIAGSVSAAPWAPQGSLIFTEPTGVVGPYDTINGWMKFTLDNNSQPIDLTAPYSFDLPAADWTSVTSYGLSVGFGCSDTFSGGCNASGTPYRFDFDPSPEGYARIQDPSLVMNPGDNLTFNAFIFTPNVAPVPPDTYFAYYYVIFGNITGTRMEQQFDENFNPILDSFGNPVFAEVDAYTTFNVGLSCASFDGSGCSGDQIFSRTVTAVPEPETYGMLLVGLGLLGFARQRKQRLTRLRVIS